VGVKIRGMLLRHGAILPVALIDKLGFTLTIVLAPLVILGLAGRDQNVTTVLQEAAFGTFLLLSIIEIYSAYSTTKAEFLSLSEGQGQDN
jgi:hypothetical protein